MVSASKNRNSSSRHAPARKVAFVAVAIALGALLAFAPVASAAPAAFADAQLQGSVIYDGSEDLASLSAASITDALSASDDAAVGGASDAPSTNVSSFGVSLGSKGAIAFAVHSKFDQRDVYNKALAAVVNWRRDALNDQNVRWNGQTMRDYLRSQGISEQTYLSPKWSNVLERIAMQRAVEAYDIQLGHTRPNGEDCFTAKVGSDGSSGEVLAGGGGDITAGVSMWASEKGAYLNKTRGQAHGETGHYEALIDPHLTRYGFAQVNNVPLFGAVKIGEMSSDASLNDKNEAPTNYVGEDNMVAVRVSDSMLMQGLGIVFSHAATVGIEDHPIVVMKYLYPRFVVEGSWSTSDPTVLARKDANTILPKAPGEATLSLTLTNGMVADFKVSASFSDVPTNHWAYAQGWLSYAVKHGLMGGYKDVKGALTGAFGPEDTLTRGQVATVLFRVANPGKDATGGNTGFSDQGTFPYYRGAIKWLKDQGIATGDRDPATGKLLNTFRPDAPITRQELAALVYRFAKVRGVKVGKVDTGSLNGFRDGSAVMPFAREAVAWCNASGIITGGQGSDAGKLMPTNNATRAQAAKIFSVLHRDVLKLGK